MNLNKSICIVSPAPPPFGGMAVQAEKLAELLEKEGFNVLRVATNPELPNGMHFFSKLPFVRTIVRQIVFLINLNTVLSQVSSVYFLTGFFNFFFWVTYPALLLMLVKRKKIILSSRGGGARLFFNKYGFLIKPVLKRLYAITVPSGFLKSAFKEELNIETIVVPNIADLKQFKFVRREKYRPRLIVTRSLEEIYDIPTVIRAFYKILKKHPNAHLGVVGGGSLRELLEKQVMDMGIENHVNFYGEVTHKKICSLYNQYDIFINASTVDNLPGSILEAFAAGLPVISTRAGGIPFMVVHGENGLLSDIGDDKTLAENTLQILGHPEKGMALAMKGYVELQKYTWPYIRSVLIPLLARE